jgi:heme exporter protein B
VGNLIFLLIVEVLTIPIFILMFLANRPIHGSLWGIALSLLVGAVGIAGIGTLLATMSVNTKGKDFILAVLFVPIMFPLLYASVAGTSAIILGDPGFEQTFWTAMSIGAGYDAIMLVAAYGLYEFIIGA